MLVFCYSAFAGTAWACQSRNVSAEGVKFATWGSAADDCSGLVGAPLAKRATVTPTAFKLARASVVFRKATQQLLGLLVHLPAQTLVNVGWGYALRPDSAAARNGPPFHAAARRREIVCAARLLPSASAMSAGSLTVWRYRHLVEDDVARALYHAPLHHARPDASIDNLGPRARKGHAQLSL